MPTVLVSGANGFVGAALCRRLGKDGIALVEAVRTRRSAAQFAIGDISSATDWREALAGCGAVVHLAARVHVMDDTSRDPLAAFRAMNVDASLNLASQAARAGVRRFIYVSSIKVNGEESAQTPYSAFSCPAPQDPYAHSKLEAETALRELSQATGMALVIVRPPLVYGPGVRANFLALMKLVKRGIPLPFGAVHNQRSMVALDNLVDFLSLCIHHPAAAGQLFMVSDGRDLSLVELLRLLASCMGKQPRLLSVPPNLMRHAAAWLGQADVARRLFGSLQIDMSHTMSTLGWQPPHTPPEALAATVDHFLKHGPREHHETPV